MHLGDDRLLAGMRDGREPERAGADQGREPGCFRWVDGQAGRGQLEIARWQQTARAELRQAAGVVGRLRVDTVEGANNLVREAAGPAPAPQAAGRHARVDQHQRDPARLTGGEQVRPQLAFDESRRIGPPVVQETGGPGGHVQRNEPVQHMLQAKLGQAPVEQLPRG